MSGADLLIGIARGLEATGAAVLFGAPLLLTLSGTPRDETRFVRPLTLAAAGTLLVGTLLALVGQTAGMAGSMREAFAPGAMRGVVLETGFGRSVAVRALAGVAALALAPAGLRTALAATGAVALASLAWSGHGAADEGLRGALHTGADVVHLLAAGAWLGALAALLIMAAAGSRGRAATRELALALHRFSCVGTLVVALILLSGLVNAWMLAGPAHVRRLPFEPWGRLLLLKLALFSGMLALAALNRWRLTPRLLKAEWVGDRATLSALRRSVGLEALLGLGAVAAAAAMGGLAPPVA